MKMKKIFLSPSTINLHEECPRCFYLHMKYEIKRPRGPMPSITIGMDSVLKRYFEYYRQIGELPPVLKNDMEGRLIKSLKPTYFYDMKKGYCLMGKLDDCLVCADGSHSPLDHKTRANPTDSIHPTYQLQMELYTILLNGNGLLTNNRAYLIYYCPQKMVPESDEQKIDFIIDIKKVDIDIKHAQQAIERAIACLEEDTVPPVSEKCEYCLWLQTAYHPGKSDKKNMALPIKNIEKEKEETETQEYKDTLF